MASSLQIHSKPEGQECKAITELFFFTILLLSVLLAVVQ